jgi:AraC-like DNA-binding protein
MTTPLISTAVIDDWQVWVSQSVLQQRSDKYMPLQSFVNELELSAQAAKRPQLGWIVGSSCNYLSRGILGKVVLGSKTLGVGLHWLCRFYPLIQDATHVKLDINGDLARLSYKILDPNIWPREQDALYTLSVFANFLKAASIDVFSQARIYLEAPKSAENAELNRVIQAPIIYGSSANEITFPAKFLNKPLAKNPPVSASEMAQLTKNYSDKNRQMNIGDRAKYVIYSAILETHVSQDYVARELGLSPRTLRRKLSAESLSYQGLLDICRMDIASLELVTSKNVSLSQMALRLGYSDHSTFSRAFLRWFGISPRTFRSVMTGNVAHT